MPTICGLHRFGGRALKVGPESELYLQHGVSGRWGRYVLTNMAGAVKVVILNVGGTEIRHWYKETIIASVVTPRRIW